MMLLAGAAASDLSFHFPYLGFASCAAPMAAKSIATAARVNLRIRLLYVEIRVPCPKAPVNASASRILNAGTAYCGCVAKTKARSWISRLLRLALVLLASLYLFWAASLAALRYIDPPTTGVQIQRRVEAAFSGKPY